MLAMIAHHGRRHVKSSVWNFARTNSRLYRYSIPLQSAQVLIPICTHSLVQVAIVGFTLSMVANDFRTILPGVIYYQLLEGLSLYARLTETRPVTGESLVIFLFMCYNLMMPFGVTFGLGLRSALVNNAYHVLLAQGILTALTVGIFFYRIAEDLVTLITAPSTCKKLALIVATCLGAIFAVVLGFYV